MSEMMQFRRVREPTDDGYVYGMCLAFFTNCDCPRLITWNDPYWTEQAASDFAVTLDKLEAANKRGDEMPAWAVHLPIPYSAALRMMRHALEEKPIDAVKYYAAMGEA